MADQIPQGNLVVVQRSLLPPLKIYDVFISFRGADTRYNFLHHLYGALRNNGIIATVNYASASFYLPELVMIERVKLSGRLVYVNDMVERLNDKSSACSCNLNKNKKTMPRELGLQQSHAFNQHKRKETAKCASSFLLSTLLINKGIHTFIDDGDKVTQTLLKAIAESRIAIPIFSVNSAFSSFCLDKHVTVIERVKEGVGFVLENHVDKRSKDSSSACNQNKHKQTMPRDSGIQRSHNINQHKREETVKRASSFILSTVLILRILSDIYCLFQSPMIKVQQQLHQEQHGPVPIWPSLLSLFGFMVFVWAVAVMILVQAPFTRMQRVMLVFWGILMHVRSASSISRMYFLILGIFLMGWQMMKEK